jgi:hypothetical protein
MHDQFYSFSAARSILQFFCRKILPHQQFLTFACRRRSPVKVPNFPLWAGALSAFILIVIICCYFLLFQTNSVRQIWPRSCGKPANCMGPPGFHVNQISKTYENNIRGDILPCTCESTRFTGPAWLIRTGPHACPEALIRRLNKDVALPSDRLLC